VTATAASLARPPTSPARRAAVVVCRILGALLVAAALAIAYADRVVFDTEAFSDRAARSLGDPRVAAYCGERIADEVIAQKRDLTAVRPLIATAARTVVGSEPFQAIFRRAAGQAHAVAFSKGAERLALSLPDFGVLLRSALATLGPEVAAKVPREISPQFSDDVQKVLGHGVLRLLRAASRAREYTVVGFGLGLVLLALSVVLPRNRRRALFRSGVALALAAVALVLLPALLGDAFTARIADAGLRGASRGVWDTFAGGFQRWALVLAGLGLVFAAAASSFASHVEVENAVQSAWAWLQRPSSDPWGELARALALLAAGSLAVFRPSLSVRLLTVLIGAALAFEGLRSLFTFVAPRVEQAAEEAAERAEAALAEARGGAAARRRMRWPLRPGLASLLVLALVGLGIAYLRSPHSLPPIRPVVTACNGDASLCDRRLDEVVFPGAHNAMSAAELAGWMFPNQELGPISLLGHGIRALLLDVHYGVPVSGRVKTDLENPDGARRRFERALGRDGMDAAMRIRDRLVGRPEGPRAPYLCHVSCEIGARPLVPVLRGIREFLVENPGEVLVLVIEDYVNPADVASAFVDSGLLRFVYLGGVQGSWPTLRDMIDSDQRVVVFGENDTAGVPWYHPAFESIQETPYAFRTPQDFSCGPNRGGTAGPLFQVNHWIETTPAPKPSNARIVNAHDFLLARARQCQQERGKLPNIVAVDFAMTGDVVGVAAELNGLPRAGLAPAPALR